MEHPAQGKRSDTLGLPHSRVSAPCKGKSFNPLCCYSYLIADLAVLKWNIVCVCCSTPAPCLKAFALTGRDCSNTRYPGCRYACPGLWATLGFLPALAKSETLVTYSAKGFHPCALRSNSLPSRVTSLLPSSGFVMCPITFTPSICEMRSCSVNGTVNSNS